MNLVKNFDEILSRNLGKSGETVKKMNFDEVMLKFEKKKLKTWKVFPKKC